MAIFIVGASMFMLLVFIMLASSKIFAEFVDSKPIGKKTVLGKYFFAKFCQIVSNIKLKVNFVDFKRSFMSKLFKNE